MSSGLDAALDGFHAIFMDIMATSLEPAPVFIIGEVRRALERRDIRAFVELFTDDAIVEEISAVHPPSHPNIVRGRDAIFVCLSKEMLHDPLSGWERQIESMAVVDEMETPDAVAFTEIRTYAAGDRLVAQHLARKRGVRIEHDRIVLAWDPD